MLNCHGFRHDIHNSILQIVSIHYCYRWTCNANTYLCFVYIIINRSTHQHARNLFAQKRKIFFNCVRYSYATFTSTIENNTWTNRSVCMWNHTNTFSMRNTLKMKKKYTYTIFNLSFFLLLFLKCCIHTNLCQSRMAKLLQFIAFVHLPFTTDRCHFRNACVYQYWTAST